MRGDCGKAEHGTASAMGPLLFGLHNHIRNLATPFVSIATHVNRCILPLAIYLDSVVALAPPHPSTVFVVKGWSPPQQVPPT